MRIGCRQSLILSGWGRCGARICRLPGSIDHVPVIVRPERADDHEGVRAVTERAFSAGGQQGIGDLVDALRAGPARVSLVAQTDGDEVVGHVLLSRGWVDAGPRLAEVLILSPLSVDPPRQGAGIGGELVRAAITAASGRGAPALFVEGPPDYYGRFGFVPGAGRGFCRPSVRIPQPAFQVVVLPTCEPWMTGALVYPDAFWIADSVGLRTR